MEKQNKMCQSCGMPLSNDPKGGGTNVDGTKNLKNCSYCFQNGEYTYSGSVQDFQELCRQKMIESGHNRFMAWAFTRGMKRLERWKTT